MGGMQNITAVDGVKHVLFDNSCPKNYFMKSVVQKLQKTILRISNCALLETINQCWGDI